MSAFIRRFTDFPALDVLMAIEATNIIDLPPQTAFLGVGSGTLLEIGEHEDGPFATGGDSADYVNPTLVQGIAGVSSQSIVEVFSDPDMLRKYGGFGFTHDGLPSSAPCARKHAGEFWNGNGFFKLKGFKGRRMMLARVDTSVGQIALFPLAMVVGSLRGPFSLAVGNTLTLTTDTGGPTPSTVLSAVAATITGSVIVASGFLGGEQITIQLDGGSVVTVTFTALDQTAAEVAARIVAFCGAGTSVAVAGAVKISGALLGTNGAVVLDEVTAGALLAIGHAAGTTAGTGNVGNIAQVTATELATIINGTAGLTAINAAAKATTDGRLQVYSTSNSGGEMQVTTSNIATKTGLALTNVLAGAHTGGKIPAGLRVTDGVDEWVTMQTLTLRPGSDYAGGANVGPHLVKVRPLVDNGSATGAVAGDVDTVNSNDQPTFAVFAVTNPADLTAARTEPQLDAAYGAVATKALSITAPSRIANFVLSARRTPVTVDSVRRATIEASERGCFGRKYITRSPLSYGADAAIADVAAYRSDRLYYTTVPLKLFSPEIFSRGAAGGEGFTDSGVIEVGAETALATLCCSLAPEEDPGQATKLLGAWLGLSDVANDYDIDTYTAFRRAGICAPRSDTFVDGLFFQSGVTSSLEEGRTEIQRRDMADFVQDSLAILSLPYSKKNPTKQVISSFIGAIDGFLSGLKSEEAPDLARIVNYSLDYTTGNSPESLARGVFVIIVKVRTFSSMKYIEIPVEIGSGVTITDLAA